MTEKMLSILSEHFRLEEQIVSEYKQMKVNGMRFQIRAFRAKNLGHVSVMTAVGFFGLMRMDTMIINPTEVDLPLLSYDRIYAMGNDTLIYEIYDTLLNGADLTPLEQVCGNTNHLPDHDLGRHWYDSIKLPVSMSKRGKKVHTAVFDVAVMEYLNAYLKCAQKAEPCPADEKRQKASVYVEGLLEHGGPSTDVFKKGIGEEKTSVLFRTVLFGTRQ